jgi:hypothetical protein
MPYRREIHELQDPEIRQAREIRKAFWRYFNECLCEDLRAMQLDAEGLARPSGI